MISIQDVIQKSRTSPFYLALLNFGLTRMIPFNKPHGIKIVSLGDDEINTFIPYKKRNLNHISGLHACSLATLAEFTTGFLLISKLDQKKYRLIMKRIQMEYFYQGKMDAEAIFEITNDWMKESIIDPLSREGVVLIECEVKIVDKQNNHLSTGLVTWQIKDWSDVKTKK